MSSVISKSEWKIINEDDLWRWVWFYAEYKEYGLEYFGLVILQIPIFIWIAILKLCYWIDFVDMILCEYKDSIMELKSKCKRKL